MSASDLREFADLLSTHIRKEERDLFEELQSLLTPEDLQSLGTRLESILQEASQACALPSRPAERT
jgi:hemerythrin-like domain-containing protein